MHFFGLIHKRPGYDPFFAENPFSPADEFVFMGLVVRSCHLDVTACAEARRLDNSDFCSIFNETFHVRFLNDIPPSSPPRFSADVLKAAKPPIVGPDPQV